jgi:hypothetical protein
MPNFYGNAKDLFNSTLNDGSYNVERDLTQYSNVSQTNPGHTTQKWRLS